MNDLIGQKLRALRKSKCLSQEELADLLCISQSTYARMENGKSNSWVNHIRSFCTIYKIEPEDLLKFSDPPKKYSPYDTDLDNIINTMITNLVLHLKEKDHLIHQLQAQLQQLLTEKKI